jgi:hypothetical protein
MEFGSMGVDLTFILNVAGVILIHVPLYFVDFKVSFLKRLPILPAVVIVAAIFLTGNFAVNKTLPLFGLHNDNYRVSSRYKDHGLAAGFYSELIGFDSRSGSQRIAREINHFPIGINTQRTVNTGINPNVIVIMSESFFDPTILPNITYSQNPAANFHRLSQDNLSGYVVVPTYGGSTANTEFEFLSGNPHVFFGHRFYMPFENPKRYFSREIPTALPFLFQKNGYKTVAVHPFNGGFYNRREIYPLIGFDERLFLEDMPGVRYKGKFVSDEYFTDKIIEQILIAEDGGEPLFLFGISMQNHWGYEPGKYGRMKLDILAESPNLNDGELSRVNVFLQGIYDADKELGRLADFIAGKNTPTMLVFFGDHMPILGRHADRVFEKLGFIKHQEDTQWDLEDRINLFRNPYLVWANYDLGYDDWQDMSVYMLSALAAEASGISLNRYYAYLLSEFENFRALTNELYMDKDGNYHHGWQYRNRPAIHAFEAVFQANMFGEDEFSRSLAELIVEN